MSQRGKFIVVSGGEGSGKTSFVAHLKETFKDENVLFTREPGGTPFAEEIRGILLAHAKGEEMTAETEILLFCAARADHIAHKVRPALRAGAHVISDRFDEATFAYQIYGNARHDITELFKNANVAATKTTLPDHYLFFDVSPEIGLSRRAKAGDTNRFEAKDRAFHERVRKGLGIYTSTRPHTVIDASKSQDEVWRDGLTAVKKILAI